MPRIEPVSPALAGRWILFFFSLDKLGSPPDSSAHGREYYNTTKILLNTIFRQEYYSVGRWILNHWISREALESGFKR